MANAVPKYRVEVMVSECRPDIERALEYMATYSNLRDSCSFSAQRCESYAAGLLELIGQIHYIVLLVPPAYRKSDIKSCLSAFSRNRELGDAQMVFLCGAREAILVKEELLGDWRAEPRLFCYCHDESVLSESVFEKAVRYCQNALGLVFGQAPGGLEDCGLAVVHVSDLHARRWDSRICGGLCRDIGELSLPRRRILAVSGDVTNNGWPWQMRAARRFVDDILLEMRTEDAEDFVCPGNHDTASRLWGVRILPWPPTRLRSFDKHFARRGPATRCGHSSFTCLSGEGAQLGVFVLDSAADRLVARGEIDSATLSWLVDRGRRFLTAAPDGVLIAVVHHHVVASGDREWNASTVMVNAGAFQVAAARAGIDLILHGHEHQAWSGAAAGFTRFNHHCYVLGAGSATKAHGSYANQYNIVGIRPNGFHVCSRTWTGQGFALAGVAQGGFRRPRSYWLG